MNQVELARHLSKCTGIAGSVCGAVVGELFGLVRAAIERNEPVAVKGFGTFRPMPTDSGGYEISFEPERFVQGELITTDPHGVIDVTEKRRLKLDSERMSTLKMIEDANLESDAEEAVEASPSEAKLPAVPPPDAPGYKPPTRSGLNPAARSGVVQAAPPAVGRASHSGLNAAALSGMRKEDGKGGELSAAEISGARKAAGMRSGVVPSAANQPGLSSLASEILGLEEADVERGLGLAEGSSPISKGKRLTFPVQISRQAKDNSSRRFKPTDGDERRQFKDLALKNFFMSLGSIVRDRETHEPLIVFDVSDESGSDGEKYSIRLLRVTGKLKPHQRSQTKARVGQAHELRYEEVKFDYEKHEVLIVIDEKLGPRIHGFDIGTFKDNDRRDRAEVCLAQEYENFRTERT